MLNTSDSSPPQPFKSPRRSREEVPQAEAAPRFVREFNDCFLKLNTLGADAVPTTLPPLDESRAVEQFRQS